MFRTAFLEIRSEFGPQIAHLRPTPLHVQGCVFLTSNFETRAAQAAREKVFYMSLNLEKYRRVGEKADEGNLSDEALLTLWAFLQTISARPDDCPQKPAAQSNIPRDQTSVVALDSKNKEASP
ncbi:hypothetical protein [uncultured Tateyamaria sp.]|uniref:hypothetical protein n=1 Tax=uncultured Tateyamaria sp. TaxID=455651 RepID=UPI00261B0361|nr:hypothetical protein [uncultured Tateyamaria sp.]